MRESRKRTNKERIAKVTENVVESKKVFWKIVNDIRKGEMQKL